MKPTLEELIDVIVDQQGRDIEYRQRHVEVERRTGVAPPPHRTRGEFARLVIAEESPNPTT